MLIGYTYVHHTVTRLGHETNFTSMYAQQKWINDKENFDMTFKVAMFAAVIVGNVL